MSTGVFDFFRRGGDGGSHEPVATLIDCQLQEGAEPEFLELWERRPRELTTHVGGPGPDGVLCTLEYFTVTLEDDPTLYTAALDLWLCEYGYGLQARPGAMPPTEGLE